MSYYRVTEIKNIDVEDAGCNPLYLAWLNKFGGWDSWVFSGKQIEGLSVSNGIVFENFIDYLDQFIQRDIIQEKKSQKQITLGYDQLPISKVEGIKGLLDSVCVLMMTDFAGASNPTWLEVQVKDGSFTLIDNEFGTQDLEFSILLPQNFNQQR